MWLIKYLIFKNLIPKIKDMCLQCSMLSSNRKKLKSFCFLKRTKLLGLSSLFFMVARPCLVGMPCCYARPTYTTTANSGLRTFLTTPTRAKIVTMFYFNSQLEEIEFLNCFVKLTAYGCYRSLHRGFTDWF